MPSPNQPPAAVMPGTMRTSCPPAAALHLLAAPAEHERVAALEPDDRRAVRRERSIIASISSCVRVWYPDCLPTYSMVELVETRSRICGETSRS